MSVVTLMTTTGLRADDSSSSSKASASSDNSKSSSSDNSKGSDNSKSSDNNSGDNQSGDNGSKATPQSVVVNAGTPEKYQSQASPNGGCYEIQNIKTRKTGVF